MDHFSYKNNQLYGEDVPLSDIAMQYGTPCYVYSRATLERHWRVFDQALGDHPHQIFYAVKANANLAVLNILARLGSGFDIVSIGELSRVLAAGGNAKRVVFSGVGKKKHEIELALEAGIHCFNIESALELQLINQIGADMGVVAPIAVRVNPDVDAKTHPYISTGLKENKFGVEIQEAIELYKIAKDMSHINIVGITTHIGSQLTTLSPFVEALQAVLRLVDDLQSMGIAISHLDMGGGLGVRYCDEAPPTPAQYANALVKTLDKRDIQLYIEPGRAIAANAGVLLTTVDCIKQTRAKNFAIVDAGMNDLLRPALYQSWQDIIPVRLSELIQPRYYDVVGPVCETGDFLGKDRELKINTGDVLAVRTAGAYGFAMSSNYNARPRAAEVMVSGHRAHLVRRRETLAELYAHEMVIS